MGSRTTPPTPSRRALPTGVCAARSGTVDDGRPDAGAQHAVVFMLMLSALAVRSPVARLCAVLSRRPGGAKSVRHRRSGSQPAPTPAPTCRTGPSSTPASLLHPDRAGSEPPEPSCTARAGGTTGR